MLFETFATTGGKPNASSVGKVMRVPEPTTVFEIGDEVLLVGGANALEKARALFER